MVQTEQRRFKLKASEFYTGHDQVTRNTWPRVSAHDKMGKVVPSLEQEECLCLCVHGQLRGRNNISLATLSSRD